MRRIVLASTAAFVVLTSCSADALRRDADTVPTTSTTLPTGTPEVLLPRLVDTVSQLSEAIIGEGDQQVMLAQALDLWTVTQPDVAATDPVAAETIDGLMDVAETAVTRKRPADADKATKFLIEVVDAYLAP